MFERSCLLPTLGRTVTAMRKRSAQRVLLTNQIPTLVQTCLAISIPDQQLAVTRLWSLVHKKMAETACARPLKRMKSKQLSPVDEDASQTIFASTHVTTLSHIVPSMHESSLDWTADRSLLSTADVAPDQPTPAASKCSLHSEGPGPGDGPCSMYAISDEDLLEEVEGGDVAHSVAQAPETFLDEDLPDELMLDAIPERDASPFPYLTVGIEALAGNPILMKDSIVDTILIAPSVGTPTADQRRHGRNRHASECDPEPTLVEEDHDEDLFSDYDYADSCISSQTSTYSASLSAYTAGSMPGLRPPDSSSALHAVEDDMLSLVSNDIDLLEVE